MSGSEKIPQPRKLGELLSRQNVIDQWRLWRSMNFVQVTEGGRLGHERPDALVRRTIEEQIGGGAFATRIAK